MSLELMEPWSGLIIEATLFPEDALRRDPRKKTQHRNWGLCNGGGRLILKCCKCRFYPTADHINYALEPDEDQYNRVYREVCQKGIVLKRDAFDEVVQRMRDENHPLIQSQAIVQWTCRNGRCGMTHNKVLVPAKDFQERCEVVLHPDTGKYCVYVNLHAC